MTTDRPTSQPPSRDRHAVLLRLDPQVHEALARWARDDLRSVNAQIEMLLRRALTDAGRAPTGAAPIPRRGRPRQQPHSAPATQEAQTRQADTRTPDITVQDTDSASPTGPGSA